MILNMINDIQKYILSLKKRCLMIMT